MMNKSKIDWCDFSWNPVTGCRHGCGYCYAAKQARRFSGDVRMNLSGDQIKRISDKDGNNRKETEFHIDNIYPADSKPQGSGQNDSQSESVSAPKSAPKRAASKAKTEPVPLDPDISDDLPF